MVSSKAREFAFLMSSQVVPRLVVQGLHFENHCQDSSEALAQPRVLAGLLAAFPRGTIGTERDEWQDPREGDSKSTALEET